MTSPRHIKTASFQPIRHSLPVRLLRMTVVGQFIVNGLGNIWKRKARRLVAVLSASLIGLLSGVWAAQAVAIMIIAILVIRTGVILDNGGRSCR